VPCVKQTKSYFVLFYTHIHTDLIIHLEDSPSLDESTIERVRYDFSLKKGEGEGIVYITEARS
jgi:hypothetical protein